ncbi:MAG: methylated-DNA--[protein]-cysteine S-methyltransferase [Planctomycetota bacterium]|nr:MAG: methylated-DNA--[protein]-cysteine S-methyltransferase [Planctomycetota bacterium]
MRKAIRYTIFGTKWGYFGLVGDEEGILRSCLPVAERDSVKYRLLKDLGSGEFESGLYKDLQGEISLYFEGGYVNFGRDIAVLLDGFRPFGKRVLRACRDVKYGETISYGGLATKAGRAGAGRAVGQVLARNPVPLIIPCHRVICADGRLGGFSAAGGLKLKKRLLELEKEGGFLGQKRGSR